MAGAELESLLAGIEAIYAELDDRGAVPGSAANQGADDECEVAKRPAVDPEAESRIAAVLATLRRIAAAAERASTLPPPPASALYGALGGANFVMRSDFLAGGGEAIPTRLPAFAYLATVIFLDRAEAERHARAVEKLVEAEGFSTR